MRLLTSEERRILNTCSSTGLMLKAAICLMLERDGGPVERPNRQLAGIGAYRVRKALVLDDLGLKSEKTLYEEQALIVGVGITGWWAKIEWLPRSEKKNNTFTIYQNVLPRY